MHGQHRQGSARLSGDDGPHAPRPTRRGDPFAAAVLAQRCGRTDEAERLYRKILARKPDHAESWSNLGLALLARQAPSEALEACERAIRLVPDYPEAHLNRIAALEATGRFDEALAAYEAALRLLPDCADLHIRFGSRLESLGRGADAAGAYSRMAEAIPGSALAHFSLGRMMAQFGRPDGAVAAYRRALSIAPDMAEALSNLGTVLATMGQYAEAAEAARRAQGLVPDNADVANNCAVVLQQGGQTAAAAEMYGRALAIDPDHPGAWANLGVALQELFRFDDAIEAFERAVALKPDFHSAIVELIKLRRHICDWSRYDADYARLLGLLDQDTDAVFMLLLMAFPSTAEQQLACARQHMKRHNAAQARIGGHARPAPAGRLKIGYLSADYRDHPVGRLVPELLAQHDRGAVEVFGYAFGSDDPGRVRRRIARACDHFIDLHGLSNTQAAARIHADGIDVLVDLTGPTTGSRLDVLTLRPAPVQVSFLGWPGTTGLDCIDYVIGDPFLMPAHHQPFYSEKIIQLPRCYQPSDPYRATALPALTRQDCGLPEDAFVFCSFNNTLKLTPDLFDLWLRLLRQVPGSVLWLYCKTPRTMANLRAWAEARGIAAERIVFAPVGAMDVYLSRLRLADLFLDSYPYQAGATCNDALWMGLPVLTCAGETYVSRMAGSLLIAAGLPDLVTATLEAYEALALRLATEPELLAASRQRLARRDGSALFDMPRFATALEHALATTRLRARNGLPPDAFAVNDVGA